MSRGRKASIKNLGYNWESVYNKNYGFYFKVLLKELGNNNNYGKDNAIDLYEELKSENGFGNKQSQPILKSEIPFKIPKNWIWCRLNEIGVSTIGITFKPSQVGKNGIPVLRANNIQNNRIDYTDLINVDINVRDKQIAKIGDILICVRSGSNNLIGKSALIEKEGMSFGAFMTLFRSKINQYVHSFMTSDLFKSQIDDKKSTGINQLTQSTLNNIIIPLPPISEQQNILKFFKEFENENFTPQGHFFNIEIEKKIYNLHKSLIKATVIKAELLYQDTHLSYLKQAILQEALKGKLVEQNPEDEPASELIKRIKAEKAKLGKKENSLPNIKAEEIPFEIPENWAWARLGDITNYGSSPKAEPTDLKPETWVLDLEDIEKSTSNLLCKVRYSQRNSLSTKNRFKKGDVLYSKLRPYLDKVIVADEDGVCTTEILPLKCYAGLNPYYLQITLKRVDFLKYVNSVTKGMKMPRLGTKEGQLSLIPIPPLKEQSRIVKEIEKQFTKTENLKEHIIANQEATEQLLKAILHQAYDVEKHNL